MSTASLDDVERLGFLLLPEFSMYTVIPAIEALRVANQNRGRKLYSWHLLSLDGKSVKAGNGMAMTVEAGIADVSWLPTVFICSGNHPLHHQPRPLLAWLRRLSRHGTILGGIDCGAFALAKAGLLDGYRATLHWEVMSLFKETYPDIEVVERLFVVDRDRITCAGGVGALDLMLHMIGRRHGIELAQIVANGFVYRRMRRGNEAQRMSIDRIAGDPSSPFAKALHEMEHNLETPLPIPQIAATAGVSMRTLTRVLRRRLGESPKRYYLKLRLQAARNALFYSDVPIGDVARTCGFGSTAVFSRTFRAHYACSPREFRERSTRDQLRRYRPELDVQLGP